MSNDAKLPMPGAHVSSSSSEDSFVVLEESWANRDMSAQRNAMKSEERPKFVEITLEGLEASAIKKDLVQSMVPSDNKVSLSLPIENSIACNTELEMEVNKLSPDAPVGSLSEEGKKLIEIELEQLEQFVVEEEKSDGSVVEVMEDQDDDDVIIVETTEVEGPKVENDEVIQEQEEKFLTWKDEIKKIHVMYTLQFENAKGVIENLLKQNRGLTLDFNRATEMNEMRKEEILDLKSQLRVASKQLEVRNAKQPRLDPVGLLYQAGTLECKLKAQLEEKDQALKSLQTKVLDMIDLNKQLKTALGEKEAEFIRVSVQMNQAAVFNMELDQINHLLHKEKDMVRKQLKNEMDKAKTNLDIINQELDKYKAELDAERQEKKKLETEKHEIICELLDLQREHSELMRKGQIIVDSDDSDAAGASTSTAPDVIFCPICNFGFTTYQAAQNHVERCLEEC